MSVVTVSCPTAMNIPQKAIKLSKNDLNIDYETLLVREEESLIIHFGKSTTVSFASQPFAVQTKLMIKF